MPRISHHSATLIDNIFINSLGYHTISGNIFSDLTDHLPNFLIIHKNCSKISKTNIFKRDYANFDEASLINEVSSIDWNVTLPQNNNVNDIFNSFYCKISEVIENHAPLKKLSRQDVSFSLKPWITSAIKVSITQKNRLYREQLGSNNEFLILDTEDIAINLANL